MTLKPIFRQSSFYYVQGKILCVFLAVAALREKKREKE